MRLYNRKRFSTFFKKLLTNQKNCAILISVIITIIDYKRSNETGTKVSDHIKSKKRKGDYNYEEMGLYSMWLCL